MRVVVERVERVVVERDYALEDLDPTQRVFATRSSNRVIAWAREVVRVYKRVEAGERRLDVPRLRSWLGGSAGSGKSTTLKCAVQHARLHFQEQKVDAKIELVACIGVAAINIGFGAKTACSADGCAPHARTLASISRRSWMRSAACQHALRTRRGSMQQLLARMLREYGYVSSRKVCTV